jgi:hypothetical protein
VRTIVTATPAPKAECPKEDLNSLHIDIFPAKGEPYEKEYIKSVLEFLNKGGSIETLIAELNKPNKWGFVYGYLRQEDITNDGIPELFIVLDNSNFILKCDKQQYVTLFSREDASSGTKISTMDLNQNSVLEIMVSINPCVDAWCSEMWLLEWDGVNLKSLVHNTDDAITTADLNGDGIQEIIGVEYLYYPNPTYEPLVRQLTKVYMWNGQIFADRIYTSDAKYRFQGVQDADSATTQSEFQKAFSLYERVISDHNLSPWSSALSEHYLSLSEDSTPSPTPSPDPTEYPRLAAYAYYRMIILHTFLGETEAAQIKYDTLQQKFPEGDPGHPYVEMAIAFWDAYQSTHTMYDACAAAIQYADEHPEILIPLGSDYHGSQSHRYVPADVCPFR